MTSIYKTAACLMICIFAAVPTAWAQESETAEAPPDTALDTAPDTTPATPPAEKEKTPPGTLRLHLMDGTVITGKLATQTLPIKTEFGDLVVPIDAIIKFQPGLTSHPELDKKIQTLIKQLSDPEAKRRDAAQEELTTFGPELLPELQQHLELSATDPERKVRLVNIIEALYSADDSFDIDEGPSVSLSRLDTVQTQHFTIAGRVQKKTFSIQSKFGKLEVKLADIKAAEQLTTKPTEIRKAVEVAGTDMTVRAMKSTAIKVKRGDKIVIHAEGQITMSPWGNNSVSGPDGIPQNGMYKGNIPMGALVGRIGKDGEELMVGSKNTIVASKSGTLYLGFAMQANWANYQFPGTYKARIRVIPAE